MELSIIIVNYNVKYFLEQCLCSVIKAIHGLEAEIFVVDNNSSDGSRALLERGFPAFNFIWNDQNSGFAKGNNIALSKATGEFILFLNPDTIVPEDCFHKCLEFFRAQKNAGALGVRMIDGAGNFLKESKRSFPSPLTSLYKLSGFAKLFPHSGTFARYHLGNLHEKKNHVIDVLAGAFMMVRQSVLTYVGSFDEQFFMYGEDIDLSYRIQRAGFYNYYFAGTTIIHFKGESTRKGSMNYVRLFYKAMFIFVRKHYGGTRAGIFKLLIQLAIFARASISGIAAAVRWIGFPIIDALLILMSFWITKSLWNHYIKTDVIYAQNLLNIAFPVFTLVFLATSFYAGLYDGRYRQERLNRSTLISILLLLAGYALLPESLRFSRGILVIGSLTAFLFISSLRGLLSYLRVIESGSESGEHRQTIIVGSKQEFDSANEIMLRAGMEERILGRVEVENIATPNAIGNLEQLNDLVKMYHIREVVLCEGAVSFNSIIEILQALPKNTRVKIHASQSKSIIGSDNKDYSGKTVAGYENLNLAGKINIRNKRLAAIVVALLFILTFPIHLLLQKKPASFFRNVFDVLLVKKEWIGYASSVSGLPPLMQGILSTTGLPKSINALPSESLQNSDVWYATDYQVVHDVKMIWLGYKYLGAKN